MKEPSELLITNEKRCTNQPVYNAILLGRNFKENEAELIITHETLHIVIFELEDIYTYNTFDNVVIPYTRKFGECIEGFGRDECLKGVVKTSKKKRRF